MNGYRYPPAEVRVTACEPLTFGDLAPVLDDLNERFPTIIVSRSNFEPPMAGALDMVISLAIVGGGIATVEFLRKFAGLLAEDTYEAIRENLRRLRDKADERAPHRVWTVTIQIGSHPFHFQGPMDDEEFRRRLLAAQAILEMSPEGLLMTTEPPNEMEPGWYWRGDLWEATPMLAEMTRRH